MWANICYALDNSADIVKVSNNLSQHQKNQIFEILPLLETKLPRKIEIVKEDSKYTFYTVQQYFKPYYRTKLKWEDKIFINKRKSLKRPIIAIQIDSQNKYFLPDKFFKKQEIFKFKQWIISTFSDFDIREIGNPLTAAQSVETACLSSLFIGICSGQSHLCHSVGVPMLLRNWGGNMLAYFHPNKSYESFHSVEEMKTKIDMMLSPSYKWKYISR